MLRVIVTFKCDRFISLFFSSLFLSLSVFLFTLSASGLGSRIGRYYWKRGKKSHQIECVRLCVRLFGGTRHFGTRLAEATQWRTVFDWQIDGHILPIGTGNRS